MMLLVEVKYVLMLRVGRFEGLGCTQVRLVSSFETGRIFPNVAR